MASGVIGYGASYKTATRDFDPANAYTPSTVGANVPSLALWLPFNETGGSITTITDVISGDYLTPNTVEGGIRSDTGDGAVKCTNTDFLAGTLVLPTLTGSFAAMYVYQSTSALIAESLGFGDASPSIGWGSTNCSITGASGTASAGVGIPVDTVKRKSFMVSDTVNNDAKFYCTPVGNPPVLLGSSAVAHGTVNFDSERIVISSFSNLPTNSLNLYGIAVFDFSANGVPSDFGIWVNWMAERWAANNKVIPKVAATW